MRLRRYLKGDTRRVWRNYRPQIGAFLLAVALVATIVWVIQLWH
jgi:hypothetical protein